MDKLRILHKALGVTLVLLLLVACGGPAATPTTKAPAPTSPPAEVAPTSTPKPPDPTDSPVPPADTPTPIPPTQEPEPTPVPPTATEEPPTPTPEPPTPTSEPPTPTTEPPTTEPPTPTSVPELAISTKAFEPGGVIPEVYSCFGDNVSPALEWSGVPAEAQSLVLIGYDQDAGAESGASTAMGFAHWVVYDIPPDVAGFPENAPAGETLDNGALQGTNDFAPFMSAGDPFPGGAPVKLVGFDGPCPGGKHRYAFAVYALDTKLELPAGVVLAEVLAAMEGHILAQAEVVGTYTPPQ